MNQFRFFPSRRPRSSMKGGRWKIAHAYFIDECLQYVMGEGGTMVDAEAAIAEQLNKVTAKRASFWEYPPVAMYLSQDKCWSWAHGGPWIDEEK